jgi:hypothetical protein
MGNNVDIGFTCEKSFQKKHIFDYGWSFEIIRLESIILIHRN